MGGSLSEFRWHALKMAKTDFCGTEFARGLSTGPGVYVMKNQTGDVLYVGKAKNLKRRVGSYFNGQDKGPRINLMIKKIASMEVSLTRTETEALLLENEWIKSYRPKFNINLRDDKSYPWIRLGTEHAYPLVSFYRGKKKTKGELFGPYSSIGAVRESLNQIYRLFKLRQCRDSVFKNRTRPCLQYQINRCSAPCVGYISESDYAQDVDAARQLLNGNDDAVIGYLVERMKKASGAKDYEQAAVFRDHIQSLQTVRSQQYVVGHQQDMDVIGFSAQSGMAAVHVSSYRNGRNVGGRTLFPANVQPGESMVAIVDAFLGQFYQDHVPPRQIMLSEPPNGVALWEEALSQRRGGRVEIKSRVRGERAKQVLLAKDNAEDALRRRLADQDQWGRGLQSLSDLIGLAAVPETIECFDISHSAGQGTVGACVVFGGEGPIKRKYRLYGVEGIVAGDDYAAMAQTLERRYRRALLENHPLPELIIIDGGQGQLSAAQAVMNDLGLDAIPLLGVAKGAARRAGHERLIFNAREVVPGPHHPASHVIQRIRDEAHRFAITAHRKKRQKQSHQSLLDGIEGIGPVKKKRLLEHFGGQEGLLRATPEDLARVPGISQSLAQSLFQALGQGHGKAVVSSLKKSELQP